MVPNNKQTIRSQGSEHRANPCETFFIAFSKLIHTVGLHQDNNALVTRGAHVFIRAMEELTDNKNELTIEVRRGRFYVQKNRLLNRRETTSVIFNLLNSFEKLGLNGLCFSLKTGEPPIEQVLTFARLFKQAGEENEPVAWLTLALKEKGYTWAAIVETQEEPNSAPGYEEKETAQRIHSYAYNAIQEVTDKIAAGKQVGLRKSTRVVQSLADLVIADDPVLMGLCTIRDYDNYTYTHSVNVSILSMCLGQQIGLSRQSLVRLGICGLFHDLGKIDIAIDIINKPGKLTRDEFKEVQKHSLNSVRQILKLQTLRSVKAQFILPPFEHHLKYDLSGYPAVNWQKPISLFGRILAITDVYDALSSKRVYRPTVLSSDRALGIMLEKSGKDFDPVLLKWFINMLGIYPVGTLLELDDGSIGLVMKSAKDPDPYRPDIMLLKHNGRDGFKKGPVVKLTERDPHTGSYTRNILRSHHPSSIGIQPAEFLI